MIKKLIMGIILGTSMLFTGCGGTGSEGETKKDSHTIVDTYKREVELPKTVEKVVILNSGVYDLVKALDKENTVIGVVDTVKLFEDDNKKEIVGTWKEPNVEKIIEMKPDVVFGYKKYMKEELAKQIEEAGIPIVYIDAYKVEQMEEEVKVIGKILNAEDKANSYLEFLNKYKKLVEERTSDIKEENKVKVYWEGYSDYATVGKGTGGDGIINSAQGHNVAGNEEVEYPKISDEWIIKNNPELIIKVASSSKNALGLGVKTTDSAKKIYDGIANRTGLSEVEAVKNKNVYVISNEIATSPQGSIIGSLYLAKWLYPNKFEDINPTEIHKELLKTYYGINAEGTWFYNEK